MERGSAGLAGDGGADSVFCQPAQTSAESASKQREERFMAKGMKATPTQSYAALSDETYPRRTGDSAATASD